MSNAIRPLVHVLTTALAACLAIAANPVAAQSYPNKPVKVIVPVVPGPLDTFVRSITDKLAERLKQPFVVENKPGAGGNVGADLVAKAPADGYTLLFAIDTTFTVNPSVYKSLAFDPLKDFVPISVPVAFGQMLAVHPSVPVNNVAELVALARQKPLNYATGGSGSPSHLTFAYFLNTAGIEMTHIPYKGTGQSVIDVVGGQVNAIFAVTTGVIQHVKSGKLRALGVSTPKRSPLAPDVPTIAEAGYTGFDVSFGYALLAPAGTPDEIVQLLSKEVQNALAQPDVAERNRAADYVVMGLNPKDSAAWLRDNREKWAKVVAKAGINAE